MRNVKATFSGLSVNKLDAAEKFYKETLGLKVEREYMGDKEDMGMSVHLPGGGSVFIYPKEDHQPATFTILNFEVDNIDEAVEDLAGKGAVFERYQDMPQDEKGIMRGIKAQMGPDIAWFKDPSGNILSVLQNNQN